MFSLQIKCCMYVCLKCGLKSKVLRVISILQHNQWCSVSLQQPGRGVQRQVLGFLDTIKQICKSPLWCHHGQNSMMKKVERVRSFEK